MSSHRRSVRLLATAQDQISEILLYTEEKWGEEQRNVYLDRLMTAIDRLASSPEAGKKRDDLSEGLRSFPVGSHLIYYWYRENLLVIARVLHYRQQPPQDF